MPFLNQLKWMSKVDAFGVSYTPFIHNQKKKYQSPLGGFITIIIYSLCFCYMLYLYDQWNSGQILPKIMQTVQIPTLIEQKFETTPFQLLFMKNIGQNKEPFETKNNILIPLYYEITSLNNILGPFTLFPNQNSEINPTSTKIITYNNFSLNYNNGSVGTPTNKILVTLARCTPKYLPEGGNCASEAEIDEFLDATMNMIALKIELSQFNHNSKSFQKYNKDYYFLVDKTTNMYSQVKFRTQKLTVDDGLLFQHLKTYQFISHFDLINQVLPTEILMKFIQSKSYFTYLFSLDYLQEDNQIRYITISELLAQVGSIVSVLMAFRIIVVFFNDLKLEQSLIEEIIGFYYPQFKNLVITRSFFGSIKKVERQNIEVYDVNKFKQWYLNVEQISKKKLNIINQLYLISRFQLVLQSLQQKQLLYQASQIGIQLNLQKKQLTNINTQNQNSFEIPLHQKQEENVNDYKLNDDDFDLWGNYDDIQKIEKPMLEIIPEKFYVANQIKLSLF